MTTATRESDLRPPPTFEPVPDWVRLPSGTSFGSEATSVALHPDGRVFVFNRGPIPVIVLDEDGRVVAGWGEGEFTLAHSIHIDHEGNLWLVDLKHVVEKRSPDGELLMTLGARGQSAKPHSGRPFNRPTDVTVHPSTGEIFVTDGYLNSAVHRFSPDGEHIASFGSPGSDPGQFSLPHGVCLIGEERLVICDRENFRLQLFTLDGQWLDQWHAYYPQAVRSIVRPDGSTWILVGEGCPTAYQRGTPNLGCRIKVLAEDGSEIARLGEGSFGFGPREFTAIHGMAMHPETADVYVAEAPFATITKYYGEEAPPGELVSLRKWRLTG